MTWRSYVVGKVNAGPVHIRCDGRNAGDHDDRQLITWWCDDRGWQSGGGIPRSNEEQQKRHKSGNFELLTIGHSGDSTGGGTRAYCARCGIDVQRNRAAWQLFLEPVAASGIEVVQLRVVARMIGRGQA